MRTQYIEIDFAQHRLRELILQCAGSIIDYCKLNRSKQLGNQSINQLQHLRFAKINLPATTRPQINLASCAVCKLTSSVVIDFAMQTARISDLHAQTLGRKNWFRDAQVRELISTCGYSSRGGGGEVWGCLPACVSVPPARYIHQTQSICSRH